MADYSERLAAWEKKVDNSTDYQKRLNKWAAKVDKETPAFITIQPQDGVTVQLPKDYERANPNVLSGMDVLNAQTGKANAPVEVEAAAGASLKKAGLTDAYNEWLDRTITANAEALTPYLKARRDWQDLYSVNRGDIYAFRDVYRNKVLNTAENAKQALKLNDEQLEDIYERTKLNPIEELNYYSGRALSGAASSIAGAAQLAAALPYYGLSVAGSLADRTVEAAGGSTQFENFFGDTAKNIMTGDPLGANWFANYVNGLVKGKYLSQTQQTISNLAENAGAMLPAIATGNIAGMLGATAAGAEAANFAVFGSGAAGNATQRAMQEGADIGTALSYGVMSGMVEVITEKMFAGIAGMNKSGVIDDLIKGLERNGTMRMLVDTLGEGVEEIVAEVIDPFLKRATYDQTATNADLKDLLEAAKSGVLLSLIMNSAGIAMRGGDISALMGSTEGMTEAETLRNDKYGRLGKTDTGMVDDTLNNYNQRIDDILNTDRNEAIKGLIRSGLSGQEGGEAYNLAWDMRQRYAEGEDLTGGELRQLYKANDNEIRQENDAEVERLAKGLAPSLSAALIDNYDNTTSPARYYLEMKNAYNAAQKGEAYKGDFLNANQISAAMQAAQSTQNNIAPTKNTGYNLLNDDYIRQMIEKGDIPNVGKQGSSTNAGWENNLASVEQGGGVEARAREAKGRRPGSFEAQRAAKIAANAEVQRAGKISGQEIHLRGTTSEKSFKVIPRSVWSQDESLDKIAQNYKKRGMNVVFIYGNIGLAGGGYARGAHRGNVMYINIADGEATAEQIAAHEYFHDFLDRYAQTGSKAFKKSADEARSWAVQQLVKKIRSDYGDGIDELMTVYAETYFTDENGNITVDADYILEEILCDAAADIDILAGRKAETQRAPLYGEIVREELNRMDEAVTRADTDDGGEKYSRGKENNGNDRTKAGERTSIRPTGNTELPGGKPGNERQNRRRTVSNGARHTDMGGRTEGEGQTTRNAKAGRAWSTFKAAERNKVIDIIKKYDSKSYEATRAKTLLGINEYAKRVYNDFLKGEVPFENKYNYDFTDLEAVKNALYDFIADNPKTRFSMATPIEETDRLVALHNINSDGLAGALELGGLAMPSFAVMNAGTIQRGYGDITIVAGKDSINPKNDDTSIYVGDAWTPTFPDVGIKIREDAAEAAESKVRALLEKAGYDKDYSLSLDADNLQDQITRWGSFEKAYGDKDEFKVAFLQDTGRGIKIPKMEKAYTQKADLATLRKVAQEVELDKANNYEAAMGYEPVLRRLIREYRIEKYGEKLADKLSPADKPLSFSDVDNILHAAREFMRRGITEQVDTKELRDRLYAAMSDEGTNAEYQAWLKKLSKDFIERRGVRNNKDLFTPSGNRRSFDQLYDAYTLANIVKAMKGQAKQGRTSFLSGSSSVKGAALKDFKDIEQVRSERNRLVSELDENGKAVYDTFSENTKNLADKIADDPFTGTEILAEVLSHAKTKTAIESYLRREYAYLHSQDGLDLSQIAAEIYELGQEANTLPIEYFEAKLYRAFPLDEALAYIVPDNINADLKAALENEGLNVIEYETGNQQDRIDKVNSVEGARFSRVTPKQDAGYLAAVERGDMDTAQKMVDEAAEAALSDSEARNDDDKLVKLYHATNAEFTVFDLNKLGANTDGNASDLSLAATAYVGHWFNTDDVRKKIGVKNVVPAYLAISNMYEAGTLNGLANEIMGNAESSGYDLNELYDEYPSNSAAAEIGEAFREHLERYGYDGIHIKDREMGGDSYVVFSSKQIKSADPVTYDDAGNVIPLSERFNPENDDIRYSRATPEESTIARLEKENAKLRERAEYWQKQTKLTKPKILNHKGVGKIASDLLTEYDSVSDHKELHAALFKLGNEILRGREEGHALTWERVTERAEALARDILNNSRVLVNTDEYQEYNELKKYLKNNKIRYQNDGNIPDFPAWRRQHKGLNLRQNEGTPADVVYNELRERFGNALFPEDIVNPADQVIRMGEVLNGFEPIFENPYSYDMALAVEESADDIIDRLLNAAEDKSFADKQEERYQALKADSAAKLSEAKAKAKQAEAIKALKADNAARLREVRKQRDDKIKTLKEYYAAAKRDRAEVKADSEARSRLLRIVKRLKNRKLPAATRAMLDGYIADIDTVAKSITGKSIEKLSELRDWYTEQIENNPNFVRDEGIEKALQRLSNRKIADMSAEEVADLTNILLGIEHEIREHNKFIESEYKKNIYEAGAQTVMDLQDVKGASLPKLNKLETEMLSPIRAIHRFVGYKDDSPLMIFANELNEGQHKMLDYQRKAYEAFNQFLEDKDFMKSLTGKHATKIKVQGITPIGEAGEAYISPAMRIALAAHAMNPQNMKHIVDGGVTIPDFDLYNKGKQAEAYSRNTRLRFTKPQLEGIAATLTPKERAFLNAVMTYFNTTSRNAINETSEALKGYSLADVENYFPINSDDAFLKNDFESLKYDGTIEGMGFLKDRIRGAANPIYLRDAVSVLIKAIEQHSRYYGLAVPLRNFNKLWNVNTRGATQDLQFDEENRPYTEDGDVINGYISSVKDAMRRAWFDAGENYIEKLVKDLSGVHKQPETFEKLLNMVRGSYAKAVLTLNFGVAVKQAASYPTAAAVLGWRPLVRAMADIGRVNMDTINKYTPVQYYRSRGYSTQELGDLAARGKSLPKALNWIQGMDVVTTRKLWKASEYYVRRANRDLTVGSPAYYSAVAAIYNRVIEETQPNYTTMQRPGLLRSESALLQSLMMFKTQPFQNYNILSDSLGNLVAKRRAWKAMGTPEAKAAYKEAKRTAVRAVTSQFVANAVFVGMAAAWALFRGKTKNYKDDDDEYTWKSVMSKIGRDMVGTAAGMVPFGSEFWELVQSLAFDETYYGIETVTTSALSDAFSAIKKAWNSTATIIDDVNNPDKEANWNKYIFQMEGVVNAISKLVGAPVENVTNLLKAVTLRAADAICDDEYEAQYVALRISTDPVTDSGAYIDNLYKAKKNGAKSYTELYNLMVNAGISENKIKTGMENRMKAAEGVEKVDELDERYLAPKQETIYQKALRELEQSDTYKAATDEQKKGAKSDLYDLYAETADGKKMREKIDEGKNYDVSDTDYIEFLLSLHEHDEPTENGNYGSYTNDEIIAALKAMDVSNKEKAYLYSTKNSSKANNPWARYLPR